MSDKTDDSEWVVVTGGATERWTERCHTELAAIASKPGDAKKEFFVVKRLITAKPHGVTWKNPTYKLLLDRWVDIARRCRTNEE